MVDGDRGAIGQQPLCIDKQHLSEELLREIGRGLGTNFPAAQNCVTAESFTRLEGTLRAILRTAQSPQISQSHRAAACNALTAFLEKCRSSSITSLQSLSRPDYLWTDIFNIYLERSDKAKVKPLRQVLVTLTSIIAGDLDLYRARRVLNAAVIRIIAIIFKQEAYSRVKPAIQALDYFITKQVISLQDLLSFVKTWQCNNNAVAISGSGKFSPIYHTANEPANTEMSSSYAETASNDYVTVLALALLHWMPEPDIAPAAGNLFITLFSTLKGQEAERLPHQVSDAAAPGWYGPIHTSIEKTPSALENLKQHILPGLFKLSVTDFGHFLDRLHLKEILSGSPVEDRDPQVMLLFTALQIGKEIGLVRGSEGLEEGLLDRSIAQTNALILPDHLVGDLLARPSATIRLAALSLLVASPLTTRPFTPGVLSLLEQNLAFFYVDTDAKFRTNVLSTAKRLVDRLRGSTSSMSREIERYKKVIAHRGTPSEARLPILGNPGKQDGAVEVARLSNSLLQRHVEFLNWYINFVITELQPTVSYQRHVTALKTLSILLQSGLDREVPAVKLSKLAQGEIKWPFHVKVLDARARRVLLDLLANPFDDVRSNAASILKMANPDSVYLLHTRADIKSPSKGLQVDSQQKIDIAHRNAMLPDVFDFLNRLERTMHLSGRADHADGVARTYEIIFDMSTRSQKRPMRLRPMTRTQHGNPQLAIASQLVLFLEEALAAARKDLALAVSSNPVHGHLAGIRLAYSPYAMLLVPANPISRLILDRPDFYHNLLSLGDSEIRSWKELHQRIIELCHGLWECVKIALCDDSPEGHIPDDFDDDGDLGTKDILSYSWRALKESSTTLRVIISNATHDPHSEFSMLDESDIKTVSQLTFVQLAELRHRGAFSTVSLTFAACCQRCFKEKNAGQLLHLWYQDALNCIRNQASTTTRRSAGIPSLITGIMSADPGGPLFTQIILELLTEAQLPLDAFPRDQKLPQVHALNCLKDAFTNSRLGPCSETYLAEALELSLKCLGSNAWAIRNCGIMLFRALADRLFGTNEPRNKRGAKEDSRVTKLSYDKYPNLSGLLKNLLRRPATHSSPTESDGQGMSTSPELGPPEAVFPAMDIIRRAGPPKPNDLDLRESILFYMGSKIWHVRDMAARTFCSLVERERFMEEVSHLINLPWTSNNALHGQLLCVRYLLQVYLPRNPTQLRGAIQSLIPLFHSLSGTLSKANTCPINNSAFLDIVNVILEACVKACYADSSTNCLLRDPINQLCESIGLSRFLDNLLASLENLDTQSNQYISSSLYRRALVRGATLYHYYYGPISGLQPMIDALAEHDPDALSDSVELLESLYATGSSLVSIHTSLDIGIVLFRALEVTHSPEVKSRTARCISEMCENSHTLAMRLFMDPRRGIVDVPPVHPLSLNSASGHPSSPSLVNTELQLWGSILSAQCTQQSIWPGSLIYMLRAWSVSLQKAGDENNEFSTRMAAAMSLNAFKRAFRATGQAPRTDAALLDPYIVLYDTLHDDDDEIRDVGATVVSWVLSDPSSSTQNLSFVPLAASLRFSEWLSTQYSHSADLSITAVRRLELHSRWLPLNTTDNATEAIKPVEVLLANSAKEDRSLFIEEKQNLFIDEVQEADVWSQVLLRMSSEALDMQLTKAYATWVHEGLLALLEKAKAMDGPLGWTAKPEVFALGVYVILGAKVVLKWAKHDSLPDCEEDIATALRSLAEVGRQTSLHELWLSQIDLLVA
ncbi:MAG: hypothetical protein M1840_005327 [Geoglossum simile]|nr:MAG: hypothetical protein M1840_005327 [Geoglossum simile]